MALNGTKAPQNYINVQYSNNNPVIQFVEVKTDNKPKSIVIKFAVII